MKEIEQRYRGVEFSALQNTLRALGATGPQVDDQVDHYFNAPDRDFARSGESFRLRRVGQDNMLTYKAPRTRSDVRERPEIEVPIGPGDDNAADIVRLFKGLGYRPVVDVRKRRSSYFLTRQGMDVTVCLDDVLDAGRFIEVEVLASDELASKGREVIAGMAAELGLTEVEQRSYLSMVLHTRARGGAASRVPLVARTIAELKAALAEARRMRKSVGLVPTMGALHAGHRALITEARAYNEFVVVSIFVNPTQFGPHEDLSRYPRPFDADLALCAEGGVDVIFHPDPATMYPAGFQTRVEVTGLQDVLEGASRPGHFRGVATVVLKLFNLVQPDRAYFGQKDAQQVRIIQQMVADLNVPTMIVVCPTIREADGLALSSRNRYLDNNQRTQATVLHRALQEAIRLARSGETDADRLRQVMRHLIEATPGAVLDYVQVVDASTLEPLTRLDRPALLVLAATFGTTRLIDNCKV